MIRHRKFITITVNEDIVKKFNDVSSALCINKSRLIESLICDWLEKQNEKGPIRKKSGKV